MDGNYCITKKDLETTSVFIGFHFHESAVYGMIPFDCHIFSRDGEVLSNW